MDNNPLAREILAENYRQPQNLGKPEHFTHSHELANRSCGDEMNVYLTVTDGVVQSINYEIKACALTVATASLLSQELAGKTLTEIKSWEQTEIEDLIGTKLSLSRVKCALLPLRGIQQALDLQPKASDF